MNPRNKVWITLMALVVVAVTVACSCSALSDLTSGGSNEPMAGLAGTWRDNAENTVHTIRWTGSTYQVVSSISDEYGNCAVSDENWDGSSFTWTYFVAQNNVSVTIQATSVSGNNLNLNWWNDVGASGTDVFTREP
jgi:hypothetical protein